MTAELTTIADWIARARYCFERAPLCYGHGADNAGDEARALVLPVLGLPPDLPETEWDRPVPATQGETLERLIESRIDRRVPSAYLTHRAWFAGMPFFVDGRVLVPRSPIAELIQERFRPWVDPERVNRILDLCTGCGCMGIAAAKAFPAAQVDLTDISAEALEVAQVNVEEHGVGDRVRLIRSDLYEDLGPGAYDLIMSNPPYVGADEMASLPREYFHEPPLSLAAGGDGLDIILPLIQGAAQRLTENGILVVEAGNTDEVLAATLPQLPCVWLEFRRGGHGVFLLHKQELMDHAHQVRDVIEQRKAEHGR